MDRTTLGVADVDDATLLAMVAAQLGVDVVAVETCAVEGVAYDIDTLTTAGRWWVRGTARTAGGPQEYAFFVKHVQSWSRSAAFATVPPEVQESARDLLPWRGEPRVYRSDLADRLPPGLAVPAARAVLDLDADSAALWLDVVDADPVGWDLDRYAAAARLLGRLAARPALRPLLGLGASDVVRDYVRGRVDGQLAPALHDDGLWQHPLLEGGFPPGLRDRLRAFADGLPSVVEELAVAPSGAAHGDACSRNLLVRRGEPDGFVLIDWAFWCTAPLGFDLSQLLIGEVQTGERAADCLADLEAVCLPAYVEGLRDEGVDVPLAVVRRSHALLMAVFAALSAVPFELLDGPPTAEAVRVTRERASAAAWVLDLVEETAPVPAG